jgi:hypothetical protein
MPEANGCALPGRGQSSAFVCSTGKDDVDVPRCQSLSGKKLDELITQTIMVALQPAAQGVRPSRKIPL